MKTLRFKSIIALVAMSLCALVANAKSDYDFTGANKVTANEGMSVLHQRIGEEHLLEVVSLKIEGTINSYDLMLMRNKMINLRHLDLSKATIKANAYEYYQGYCSHDNTLEMWCLNDELLTVKLPDNLKSVKKNAFKNLKNIEELVIPAGVTEIGDSTFHGLDNLKTVTFASGSECKYIGTESFSRSGITSISIPASVDTLGFSAFRDCSALTNVRLEDGEKTLYMKEYNNDRGYYYYYDEYGHDHWNYPRYQYIEDNNRYTYYQNFTFAESPVTTLYYGRMVKCGGYYDHYEFYPKYHNGYPDSYWDYEWRNFDRQHPFTANTNLTSVEFGPYVETVDTAMFAGCSNLSEVKGIENVKNINYAAFYKCSSITGMKMHKNINYLGDYCFARCTGIVNFTFDDDIKVANIPNYFLYGANNLYDIALPKSTETIGNYAFYGCELMQECKISERITKIGDYAFNQCNNLNKVHAYTLEPQKIDQNTFSTYHTATLYMPAASYFLYFYDTQWSQFLNLVGEEKSFTDLVINTNYNIYTDTNGAVPGKPNVEINAGASLIINGNVVQPLADIHIKADHINYGSIIGNGNIKADKLYFELNINKDAWYFFSFPYDIPLANVTKEGSYKWAEYDGAQRANNGTTGWKNLAAGVTKLLKGKGYIFRSNFTSTLTIRIDNPSFSAVNEQTTLTSHASSEEANADWNMVGNPYTAYYPINKLQYGAPIIVWNGTTYDAYRPADDDYILHPFEAFFVQKANGTDKIGFDSDSRQDSKGNKGEAKNNKAKSAFESFITDNNSAERKFVNITLSDGDMKDKTRVVFNEAQSLNYERECDAVKFMTQDKAPQLYTIGNDGVRYAINERPVANGKVALGFYAPEDGIYTLSAADADISVYDAQTGATHNLADADFTFNAAKGVDNARFVIISNDVTAAGNVEADAESDGVVYDLAGRKMGKAGVRNGMFIKGNKKYVVK